MPGYDKTGPNGAGSMTGGGRGSCSTAGNNVTGRPRAGGFFGRGGGRGRRNRFYATGLTRWQRNESVPANEKEELKSEAEMLKQELKDVQACIDALEKEK
ncbi:MAG: DUF5320 domain-containing protein [Candidatus Aadella gelida]|nr:DUF5320 domain-containing protein [Candidatus Aadella gelida]